MSKPKPTVESTPATPGAGQPLFHRSGAVARMLRMPVATLRVWERRYGLTQTALSPSGQRLYAAEDVRRLALIKQLTDLGHAIGSLATLDMAQLQRVAATHAQALAATQFGTAAAPSGSDSLDSAMPSGKRALGGRSSTRWVVIGTALDARIRRPSLLQRLARPVELLGPFANVAQAAAACGGEQVDAVLIQEPHLHAEWLASFNAAGQAFAGVPKALLYGFAAGGVCDGLASAGIALLREPQSDAVVAQWLQHICMPHRASPTSVATHALGESTPPRRWDDAALADFAGLSQTMACECPRHVAELLMQLSRFEAYSAECMHRNAADAQLHAYLKQVAASSRARFEAALEAVALHEGLLLPPATP